jgi:hypothetical protein
MRNRQPVSGVNTPSNAQHFKTVIDCRAHLPKALATADSWPRLEQGIGLHASPAASTAVTSLWANATFASRGPGTSPGTASRFTPPVMAVIVCGTSALLAQRIDARGAPPLTPV